jgi:hypothetical protein
MPLEAQLNVPFDFPLSTQGTLHIPFPSIDIPMKVPMVLLRNKYINLHGKENHHYSIVDDLVEDVDATSTLDIIQT